MKGCADSESGTIGSIAGCCCAASSSPAKTGSPTSISGPAATVEIAAPTPDTVAGAQTRAAILTGHATAPADHVPLFLLHVSLLI